MYPSSQSAPSRDWILTNTTYLITHTHICTCTQWCIARNGGGYMQRGVAKGLKVPCLFMITEVSIPCQKTPEVGIRRIPAYTPPIHHCMHFYNKTRACNSCITTKSGKDCRCQTRFQTLLVVGVERQWLHDWQGMTSY